MIPRFAPTYSYTDLLHAIRACYSGQPSTTLRDRLAALYGVRHVFLFARARVALYALLKAYGRPGGVLMPAYNCIVVPEAVTFAGYQPVFVDIDRRTLNMSMDGLAGQLSPAISVVLATHLFGVPCDVESIRRAVRNCNVLVVEDAAPALGARFRGALVGTLGDAAIISFHATKAISAEAGGALLVNDDDLAHKVDDLMQALVAPGGEIREFATAIARKTATTPWVYSAVQSCYRLLLGERMYEIVSPQIELPPGFLRPCSDLSSSLILNQLEGMETIQNRRRKLAQIYQDGLSNLPWLMLPTVFEGSSPAWMEFPVQTQDKRAFYKHMQRHGVDLTWTYRYSCAESYGQNNFPNARQAAKSVLGLPTYPSLSDEGAQYISRVAKQFPASKY